MNKFTVQNALDQLSRHRSTFQQPDCHDASFMNLYRHGSMEVEICKPNRIDLQKPHDKDEIYFIASGTGFFQQESECEPVKPGDVLFVPAGVEHKFVNFSSDFSTWVVFYGPNGGECKTKNI